MERKMTQVTENTEKWDTIFDEAEIWEKQVVVNQSDQVIMLGPTIRVCAPL